MILRVVGILIYLKHDNTVIMISQFGQDGKDNKTWKIPSE